MYLVEYRGRDGDVLYWEVSKAVPRDASGNPVEHGELVVRGERTAEVLDEIPSYPQLVPFLKDRSDDDIRVTEAESAWKSAQSNGPSSDRRIKPRGATVSPKAPVRRQGSVPMESVPRPPIPILRWLVVAAIIAALVWFFVL